MWWLRVYAWLRVKIKAMGTDVRGYASTRGYASKLRLRVQMFVVFCRVAWIKERSNLLCGGYASTRGYASKLKLRVLVPLVFCRLAWITERSNFLCGGYASKLRLRVLVFVVFCLGTSHSDYSRDFEKARGFV